MPLSVNYYITLGRTRPLVLIEDVPPTDLKVGAGKEFPQEVYYPGGEPQAPNKPENTSLVLPVSSLDEWWILSKFMQFGSCQAE